jgi:hypothetical protein
LGNCKQLAKAPTNHPPPLQGLYFEFGHLLANWVGLLLWLYFSPHRHSSKDITLDRMRKWKLPMRPEARKSRPTAHLNLLPPLNSGKLLRNSVFREPTSAVLIPVLCTASVTVYRTSFCLYLASSLGVAQIGGSQLLNVSFHLSTIHNFLLFCGTPSGSNILSHRYLLERAVVMSKMYASSPSHPTPPHTNTRPHIVQKFKMAQPHALRISAIFQQQKGGAGLVIAGEIASHFHLGNQNLGGSRCVLLCS